MTEGAHYFAVKDVLMKHSSHENRTVMERNKCNSTYVTEYLVYFILLFDAANKA